MSRFFNTVAIFVESDGIVSKSDERMERCVSPARFVEFRLCLETGESSVYDTRGTAYGGGDNT